MAEASTASAAGRPAIAAQKRAGSPSRTPLCAEDVWLTTNGFCAYLCFFFSSSSITVAKLSNGMAPEIMWPLMKNVGVPKPPVPSPLAYCTSLFDRLLVLARVEVRLELRHVEPDLARVLLERRAIERLLIGEHLVVHLPELALRVGRRAASAAPCALLWNGSGKLRNEMRTLPSYFSSICLIVGTTREQNGHWKSENSTICTGAVLRPHRRRVARVDLVDLSCPARGPPAAAGAAATSAFAVFMRSS